jgi:hypothetical protein
VLTSSSVAHISIRADSSKMTKLVALVAYPIASVSDLIRGTGSTTVSTSKPAAISAPIAALVSATVAVSITARSSFGNVAVVALPTANMGISTALLVVREGPLAAVGVGFTVFGPAVIVGSVSAAVVEAAVASAALLVGAFVAVVPWALAAAAASGVLAGWLVAALVIGGHVRYSLTRRGV